MWSIFLVVLWSADAQLLRPWLMLFRYSVRADHKFKMMLMMMMTTKTTTTTTKMTMIFSEDHLNFLQSEAGRSGYSYKKNCRRIIKTENYMEFFNVTHSLVAPWLHRSNRWAKCFVFFRRGEIVLHLVERVGWKLVVRVCGGGETTISEHSGRAGPLY